MIIVLHAATFNQSGCVGATASASVVAILLTLCMAIFITIILFISIKMKKQAHIIEMAMQRRSTTVARYDEVDCQTSSLRGIRASNYVYDEVDCQSPKETAISTNKNIAYSTAKHWDRQMPI